MVRAIYLAIKHLDVNNIPVRPDTYAIQCKLTKHLHSTYNHDRMCNTLRARAGRYDIALSLSEVSCLVKAIKGMASKLKPRTHILYLKTICNGWATSARMQIHESCCKFCGGSELDSLGHILQCPIVSVLARLHLDLDPSVLAFSALWGLSDCPSYVHVNVETRIKI